MIQQKLLPKVSAIMIQGVEFDLPLKFFWHDRETAKQWPGRVEMMTRVRKFIFSDLCGRN